MQVDRIMSESIYGENCMSLDDIRLLVEKLAPYETKNRETNIFNK